MEKRRWWVRRRRGGAGDNNRDIFVEVLVSLNCGLSWGGGVGWGVAQGVYNEYSCHVIRSEML